LRDRKRRIARRRFLLGGQKSRHWNDQGEIVEEKLFYDMISLMQQIGLAGGKAKVA
jgi:hypothetical protein